MNRNSIVAFERELSSATPGGTHRLPKSYVFDTKVENAHFVDFHLDGGSLCGSVFEHCVFERSSVSFTCLDHVTFRDCDFRSFVLLECSTDELVTDGCDGEPSIRREGRESKWEFGDELN